MKRSLASADSTPGETWLRTLVGCGVFDPSLVLAVPGNPQHPSRGCGHLGLTVDGLPNLKRVVRQLENAVGGQFRDGLFFRCSEVVTGATRNRNQDESQGQLMRFHKFMTPKPT